MKYNMYVAYDGETKEAQYIYFEDPETNDLVKVEFGGEDEYGASEALESMVYSPEGYPAYDVSDLTGEEKERIYKNFTYDLRETYSFPPLSVVFAGTSLESVFTGN